jgi:hypothetical protein
MSLVGDVVGGEVGLALLGEGGRAFPGLVGDGEDVQARLRHLGRPGVGVGVERVLEEADRGRAVLRKLVQVDRLEQAVAGRAVAAGPGPLLDVAADAERTGPGPG